MEPLSVETLEVLRMIDNFGYPGLLAIAAVWISRVGKHACEHLKTLGPITLDVNLRLAESEIDELQRRLAEAEERLAGKRED